MSPLRSLLRRVFSPRLLARVNHISHSDDRALDLEYRLREVTRLLLRQQYPKLLQAGASPAPLREAEFSIYSQEGVDGILLAIFSEIGVEHERFVEIGCGDGRECNTANLSLNLNWSGTLIDADPVRLASARRFYDRMLKLQTAEVTIVETYLTRDNVNQVITDSGVSGEIDLLSIDLDGNDYWIWNELTAVQPRVVVAEYNASFGPDEAITVPYAADFDCFSAHPSGFYHGASLAALAKLADSKGYTLVAVESQGVNAIFLRRDLAERSYDALEPIQAYTPHFQRGRLMSQQQQYSLIKGLELVRV